MDDADLILQMLLLLLLFFRVRASAAYYMCYDPCSSPCPSSSFFLFLPPISLSHSSCLSLLCLSLSTCPSSSLCWYLSVSVSVCLSLLLSLLHLSAFYLLITAVSVGCSNQLTQVICSLPHLQLFKLSSFTPSLLDHRLSDPCFPPHSDSHIHSVFPLIPACLQPSITPPGLW